jgi:serine/threonine-protein kinase
MARSSPPPPPPPPAETGNKRLSRGRIELIEVAGQGGMSMVWRAWLHGSAGFRRAVAVKHMFPHLAAQKMYREMFIEEARVGSLLEDPNIPQVYEYLVTGNEHYIVMEFVEGINLATLIRYTVERLGRPIPWELVAAIGIGMLRGLSAAHERFSDDGRPAPIIHRDVSPHNIMISAKGPAKLIDFGLSFARDRRCGDTDPGVAKGKLPYLAPEIVRGGRPSRATDQFAAGSVLWEALVGRRLFDDVDKAEAYRRLSRAEVPPAHRERRDVPRGFVALIDRALQLDPTKRFPSTRDMAKGLGDVLKGSTSKEDLYATLARWVAKARDDLGMGHKTGGSVLAIPEVESGLVELLVEDDAQRARA